MKSCGGASGALSKADQQIAMSASLTALGATDPRFVRASTLRNPDRHVSRLYTNSGVEFVVSLGQASAVQGTICSAGRLGINTKGYKFTLAMRWRFALRALRLDSEASRWPWIVDSCRRSAQLPRGECDAQRSR